MKPLSNLSKFIQLSSRVRRRRQWHPTQYSCLENPMDRGAWWAAVHWVAKSWTQLSNFTCTFHFHALSQCRLPSLGSLIFGSEPPPLRRNLQGCDYLSHLWIAIPGMQVLNRLFLSLLLFLMWLFLYILSCREYIP